MRASCGGVGRLQVDDLVGELHGGHDVEHIRGLAHLLLLEKLKMVQAGAADQDLKASVGILLQHGEQGGSLDGEA